MTAITSLDTANTVSVGDYGVALCTFTRPNNTTAYTAGDVISDDAVTGKCMAFAVGKAGEVVNVTVAMEETKTANLDLLLFDAEPTNFADNAALALVTGDLPKIVAKFALPDATKSLVGTGLNVYEWLAPALSDSPGYAKPFVTTAGVLYGLLVTRSAYTPVASIKFHVKVTVRR